MYQDPHRDSRRGTASGSTPSDVAHELAVAVEELTVAEEELRAQTDELALTRGALVRDHRRYRELFELAPVAYIVTDAAGTIRDANRASARLFGTRLDRLQGKPAAVFVQDASRRRLRTVLVRIADATESITVPLRIVDRRGRVRRIDATIAVGRGIKGEVDELRWLLVDQTPRARRERRVRRRGELLEMGIRGPLLDTQLADVRRIHNAYEHLAHLVDDLLTYSRVASGQVAVDVTDVVLGEAVRAACDLLAPQARARNVTLTFDIEQPNVTVRADGERLRQVILNLLGNAIKFTRAGGSVKALCRTDDDHGVIDIADDGAGIPADKLESIFQPFVRLHSAAVGGTGLGLSISRDLARAMGGDLTVASVEDRGSIFTIRLPLSTRLATSGSSN